MNQVSLFFFALLSFVLLKCGQHVPSGNENNSENQDSTKTKAVVNTLSTLPLQISFPSLDGIVISANSYFLNDSCQWILLCHQAGYSKGEYKETAPKFNVFGYNCLAIDQRAGEEVNGIKNETAARAKAAGKPTTYLDAEQDIRAAIRHLWEQTKKPIIVVGSSYSAGLVLKIANGNPYVKAVLAYSPGEYYGDKLRVAESVMNLNQPVFITSAKSEVKDAKAIFDAVHSNQKTFFEPTSPGKHASSCLWESTNDYKEYWKATEEFLNGIK